MKLCNMFHLIDSSSLWICRKIQKLTRFRWKMTWPGYDNYKVISYSLLELCIKRLNYLHVMFKVRKYQKVKHWAKSEVVISETNVFMQF